MTISILSNIFRFFLLIAVQVLVLNNVGLAGFVNPYLYLLFIIALPFEIGPIWVLLLSFITGLSVDVFSDSLGMHAAATTFMGLSRIYILKILEPRDGYQGNTSPTIKDMGFEWFIAYALILVFLHHFVYFFIEVFRFQEILQIILRIILSVIFTLFLIVISQYLFLKTEERK